MDKFRQEYKILLEELWVAGNWLIQTEENMPRQLISQIWLEKKSVRNNQTNVDGTCEQKSVTVDFV